VLKPPGDVLVVLLVLVLRHMHGFCGGGGGFLLLRSSALACGHGCAAASCLFMQQTCVFCCMAMHAGTRTLGGGGVLGFMAATLQLWQGLVGCGWVGPLFLIVSMHAVSVCVHTRLQPSPGVMH
jgi:hypothetical protein